MVCSSSQTTGSRTHCTDCMRIVLFSALVLHWVTHVDTEEDSVAICRSCQGNMSKYETSPSGGTLNQNRMGFGRVVKFGGDVTTDIAAIKRPSKREKLESDAIPMGKIACRIETTQDRRDADSMETADNDCTVSAKVSSIDQIHEAVA